MNVMAGDRLFVAIFVVVVLGLLGITFAAFSSEDEPTKNPFGVVLSKGHKASWVQFINTGKITVTVPHPARWWVVLDGDGAKSMVLDMSREDWEAVEVGDYVSGDAEGEEPK